VWIRSSDNRYFYFDGRRWIETGDNRIGQNSAAIQTEQTARATADQALANQITTVQATLNGQLASVRRDINVTMDNVTGLRASYVLTTDVNGYVSGFGTYNDGKTSDFAVSADRFWIAPPNSWGKVKPFIVQNGRVYIDEARIRNAAIDTAHIKHAAVDTLQVAGQAITVPSGAYYSNKVLVHDRRTNNHGTFDYAEVGSSYKLASAYVNSAGGRAFVNFTGWMRLADRTVYDSEGVNYFYSAGITLQLRRGSTIVQQMRLNTAPATRVESPWVTSSLVWIDEYPGSITHEYSVWAVDPRRGAYFDARSITVIGLKR
jgi:hypothetical protein